MINSLYNLIKENLLYANMENFGLVFASQNMPRMLRPYIVMNVLNVDVPDHVIYGTTINAMGFRDMWSWRRAVVELQFYNGIESLTSASALALGMQSEQSLLSQDKLNCAIGKRLFFSYVPEMVNLSHYEGRAIYHFEYFFTESMADNVGIIETVVLDGTYTGGATTPDVPPGETSPIVCHEVISYKIPYDETYWDGTGPEQYDKPDDATIWDEDSTIWDEVING